MTQRSACSSLPRTVGIVTAFLAVACASPSARAVATAHLVMHSQYCDWTGMGRDYDLTYVSPASQVAGGFFYPSMQATEPSGVLIEVQGDSPGPGVSANLRFSTGGLGIPIAPGMYNDAVRFPWAYSDPTKPGLGVTVGSRGSRGSNTLTGIFTITELTRYPDRYGWPRLSTLADTSEQHSEGNPAALRSPNPAREGPGV